MIIMIIFLILIAAWVHQRRGKNRPNLPPEVGIFGFLPMFVHFHLGKFFTDTGNKHGPIVYTRLGPFKMILLNGADTIKEACKIPSLNGRIDCMYKEIMGHRGILWTDDTVQKRKFIFRNSRNFGFGGKSAEASINEEINQLFKHFDSLQGKPFSTRGAFNIPTLNGVLHQFFGQKLPQDDPAWQDVVKRLAVIAEVPGPFVKASVFAPALTKWVPDCLSRRGFIAKVFKDGMEFTEPYLERHKKTRIPNEPRDFIDALMDEVEATKDSSSPFHASQDPIRPIVFDMISAAIETTGAALEWVVLYLSFFPEVQEKLQCEVDNVIGRFRLPELMDRQNMPYLQAFLQEIFRIAPVIPFWFHMALEDTDFRGYTFEKGTYVVANFYGAHMDPKTWENPGELRPERFINNEGQFVKSDQLFFFGSGKRSCVGEVTARDQLFLYVSRIAQTYNVVSKENLKCFDGNIAVGYHCCDFKTTFKRRV